ncbi:MAG: polysaccharide biosynthesis C-terminal domain-containing protein [Planctomycetes bacterium]|nr:polysaccharide biosynthesis C-terminal domain-containing protein [Planctomycetota bacterium]
MKSVLQVFAGDFTAKVLLGLAGLALIRFLPPVEFALFTLATVISAFVVQGMTGNLNQLFLVGRKQLGLDESAQTLLGMQLWLIAILAVLAVPFVLLMPSMALLYGLVVALTTANCLLEFSKTFYQQQLKFVSFSLIEFSRTLLFVGALIALIVAMGDSLAAWHVLLLQSVCVMGVVLIAFGRHLQWSSLLRLRDVLQLTRRVFCSRYLFMLGYFFGVAMLVRIDVLMLGLLDGEFQLATFGASFRYYTILMMMLAALHTVFLPLTQRVTTRGELRTLFRKQQKLVAVVVPVIVVGAWASAWIIPWIDRGKYPETVAVFRVLSLSAIVSLICSPRANLLLKYGSFRFLFTICAGAILLNVGLNAIVIPRWHAVGAAWATLVAAGSVNVLIFFQSRRLLANRSLPKDSSTDGNPAVALQHSSIELGHDAAQSDPPAHRDAAA